ncbi:MAG: acyltransferase family protein [Aureispira sp.]
MLSGFLLLNKDYELKDFLLKRFSRVFLPFLFWTCFYCFQQWLSVGNSLFTSIFFSF